MHPDISVLPSRLFYGGRLLDGPNMTVKTQRPWHDHPKFGPYRFYNVLRGVEETGSSHSFLNRAEAEVAAALYNRMHTEFISRGTNFTVGVVTMYKAQMNELRRTFERRFGSTTTGIVDFNTVDGFQGQEKDVIILSCVRAGPGVERVGFLAGEMTPWLLSSDRSTRHRREANERCSYTCQVFCVHSRQCGNP